MMKAAVALGVKCKFCHAGKKKFTGKLEIAVKMIKLAEMMDVKCSFAMREKTNLPMQERRQRQLWYYRDGLEKVIRSAWIATTKRRSLS